MADRTLNPRRLRLIAIAAAAGVLVGVLAVYFIGSGQGNGLATAGDPDCAGAVAAAQRAAPFAKGEIAAFQPTPAADKLSDLTFKSPDGADLTLASFAGKNLLINLWATWCVPCRSEMPALDRLQAARGGKGFEVVAINLDLHNPDRAKAFLSEIGVKGLTFYSDPSNGLFGALKKRGLAFGLPTTLLVDGKGCRVGDVLGPAEWDSHDAQALLDAAAGSG